jgi:hypothetical protein
MCGKVELIVEQTFSISTKISHLFLNRFTYESICLHVSVGGGYSLPINQHGQIPVASIVSIPKKDMKRVVPGTWQAKDPIQVRNMTHE